MEVDRWLVSRIATYFFFPDGYDGEHPEEPFDFDALINVALLEVEKLFVAQVDVGANVGVGRVGS